MIHDDGTFYHLPVRNGFKVNQTITIQTNQFNRKPSIKSQRDQLVNPPTFHISCFDEREASRSRLPTPNEPINQTQTILPPSAKQ